MYLLCRNRVRDFDRWLDEFSAHRPAHVAAGLVLEQMWRDCSDPGQVRYLFRVESEGAARAFIATPEAADAAAESGVIDGEYHFVEAVSAY